MANLTFKTGTEAKFPDAKTPGQLSFITNGTTGSIYLDIDANNRVKFNADAKKLDHTIQINDTDFDGSSPIRTNSWGWNREFKIGNYTLDVDGSQEKYEWSLKNIGISKKYASFATPSSNSWGWYTIATISDSSTSPAIFMVRAHAHSSIIFTATKGYSSIGSLNVLDYNASANQDYATIAGARLMSDGRVQIYLRTKKTSDPTQNAIVDVEINAINSSDTLTIANTLVADDTANPSVIITRNCTVTGNIIGNLQGSASSLRDRTNGTETYLNYGAEGISSASWFAAWNGYELRGISPVNSRITMSALSATSANGHYGMGAPDGNVQNWIRTTEYGIIPYQSGGCSSLGTDSWPFNNIYTNNLISFGPIKIGNNGNGDSNYIAFYGTTGDGPGSYIHTYIGENLYGGTEGSELVLFKGNDVDNNSGPDRIRHIAARHLFQTYDTALSGTWTTICDSTAPATKLEIKPSLISSMVDISITGWVRTIGDTGWRNETYGGGWHMSDDTWIRAYNDKKVYVSNTDSDAIYTSGGVKTHAGFTVIQNGVTTTISSYNSSWTHYETSAPGHWFNKSVSVAGNIYAGSTYSDLVLTTANYSGYLDSRYLKLSGGTMNGTAFIRWPDTGNWSNSNSGVTFPVTRGGLEWYGQSDWIKLFAEETASDQLNLVCQFGDDASPALVFRNKDGTQVARIGADGTMTATTFNGSLSGNAATATALTSSAGSSVVPVYFSNGKPVAVGSIWTNSSTSSTTEFQVGVVSAAGALYMYSNGSATGSRGLYGTNNGGTAVSILTIDSSNNVSLNGNAASATKLQTARTIFGRSFNGTSNVEGQVNCYGSYTATANQRYYYSALEIRENGLVGNAQSDIGYAPSIGFHWANRIAATLNFHNDGIFYFRKQDGVTRATIDANVNGWASSAGSATTASYLVEDESFNLSRHSFQYFNISGTAGAAVSTNDTPTTAWWHIQRHTHANSAGFYTDVAIPFNDNQIYYKRVANGTLQNGGWVMLYDTKSIIYSSTEPTSGLKVGMIWLKPV